MSAANFVVQSLHRRPGTISLEEARRRPEIVYHSIRHLATPKKAAAPVHAPVAVPSFRLDIAPATPVRAPACPAPRIRTTPRPVCMMAATVRTVPQPVRPVIKNVRMAPQPVRPVVQTARPVAPSAAMTLVPLSVAAARKDIKYRPEGFEMKERRLHKRLFRSNMI